MAFTPANEYFSPENVKKREEEYARARAAEAEEAGRYWDEMGKELDEHPIIPPHFRSRANRPVS